MQDFSPVDKTAEIFFNLSKGNPQKVFSLTSHLNSWFELTAHYNVFVWESQK